MRLSAAALACALLAAPVAHALNVEGREFAPAVTVDGKALKLVGAGVREKWFFKVYAMAAYSTSGACSASSLVNADEPKYLRIEMLRSVDAAKMGSTIGEAFDEHMPKDASPALRSQRATFQGYFTKACSEGSVLEFLYDPAVGTTFRQNGQSMGSPLAGREFARVLWDIYFGTDSCCDTLKASVLRCGR